MSWCIKRPIYMAYFNGAEKSDPLNQLRIFCAKLAGRYFLLRRNVFNGEIQIEIGVLSPQKPWKTFTIRRAT